MIAASDSANRATRAWPISPPAPVIRVTGWRMELGSPASGGGHLALCECLQPTPCLRVLTKQRVEIKGDRFRRVVRRQKFHRRHNLLGIGRDGLSLNDAVLVRDAERIEKGPHHRSVIGQMV